MTEKMPPAQRELNPFAFPAETNAFFTLLAFAAPVWMLELGKMLGEALRFVQSVDMFSFAQTIEEQGLITLDVTALLIPILLGTWVVGLAALLYIAHPIRIRYGRKLRPITEINDPPFLSAIQDSVKIAGVSLPRVEISKNSHTMDGQAFGISNKYSLRMGDRLRLLLRKDPGSFRAIVLHELAHIANGDILRAYLTQSIWMAVLILTVLPTLFLFVLYLFRVFATGGQSATDLMHVVLSMIKVGLVLLIITAIYRNLLRARELYADCRASIWGAREALGEILRRNSSSSKTASRWKRFWKLHPTARERLEALHNRNRFFTVRSSLAFFVGALPGLMLGGLLSQPQLLIGIVGSIGLGLERVFGPALFNSPAGIILLVFLLLSVFVVPTVVILPLITNSLGLAVQRESIAGMAFGQTSWTSYLGLLRPAFIVALGYQLGTLLAISSILEEFFTRKALFYVFSTLFSTLSFTAFTWLGLLYVGVFARQIIGTHAEKSYPRRKMSFLAIMMNIMLIIFYVPLVFGQLLMEGMADVPDVSFIQSAILAIVIAEVIGIVFYALAVAGSWLWVWISRNSRQLRCPTCGHITRHRYAVGHSCEHCGNQLAAWLYVT